MSDHTRCVETYNGHQGCVIAHAFHSTLSFSVLFILSSISFVALQVEEIMTVNKKLTKATIVLVAAKLR